MGLACRKKILTFHYHKGTPHFALTYAPDPSSEVFTTFSDADHSCCKGSGRSTGAYVVKMGTGAISWSSKPHGLVAQLTTEAEYIAAVEGVNFGLCTMVEFVFISC